MGDLTFRRVRETEGESFVSGLREIWSVCFSDTSEGTDFVMKNIYPESRCYGCFSGSLCCAALYLIDALIPGKDGVLYKGHYLFGAGTLPAFRGLGIMSRLIEYSLSDSLKEGDKASVLLPASQGLYSYYGKLGYKPLYGTVMEDYSLPAGKEYCGLGGISLVLPGKTDSGFENINIFENIEKSLSVPVGYMRFSEKAAKNAVIYNSIYGGVTAVGKDFSVMASDPFKDRALVYMVYGGEKERLSLYNWLGESFGCKNITARVPGESDTPFGMMRVLDESADFSDRLYIGFTKD